MSRSTGTVAAQARGGLSSERLFLGTSVLLFVACAVGTIYWSRSMSMAGGMSLPVGWAPSMDGMSLSPLDWLGAAGAFIGMWLVMMASMMLPSLVPALRRYRLAVCGPAEMPLGGLTALAGLGYFAVWGIFGAAVFPLGAALSVYGMQSLTLSSLAPFAPGAVLLLAGGYQLTAWKTRQLTHCLETPALPPDAGSAWRHGIRLGVHCSLCCLGFMAVLLVNGVMDLGVMALVAAAITFERLVPWPERAARINGAAAILIGAVVLSHALGIF